MDMTDTMENWINANNAQGNSASDLEKLTGALGYSDLQHFIMDNPGAVEAIFEFVTNADVPEWAEALYDEEDDEEEEEEETTVRGFESTQTRKEEEK